MRLTLDAAHESNREMGDSISALQTTLDSANWHEASGDNRDVEERRVSIEQLQSDLVAAEDIKRELSDRNDELQMALDDANHSEASGNEEYVQELEYSLREKQLELDTAHGSSQELQEKNQLLQDQLGYVAEANWENMRPFLDRNLTRRIILLKKKISASDTELSKVKEELSKANAGQLKSEANSTELREENQALRKDLETKSAELDALRKEASQPAPKAKMTPGEREQLNLKDRDSVYVHSGW